MPDRIAITRPYASSDAAGVATPTLTARSSVWISSSSTRVASTSAARIARPSIHGTAITSAGSNTAKCPTSASPASRVSRACSAAPACARPSPASLIPTFTGASTCAPSHSARA